MSKTYHPGSDQPVALRRKLLLGLPGGLALTPLGASLSATLSASLGAVAALAGCGGGGGSGEQPAAGPDDSLREPGRAFAGTQEYVQTDVTVDVPPGVSVPEGGLAVYTALGGFGVFSGNQAKARQLTGTPQWAALLTAEGLPLLFGFVGTGMNALSAHSTATALLAVAMGAEFAGGSANAAWIEELRTSPATASCAQAIAAALAADPYALATGSSAITDAVRTAITQILPSVRAAQGSAGRARALGVGINPPNAASGVQPIIGGELNTVFLQNEKLRRAYYVIRREGHTPSAGAEVPDTARPKIASGDIPMLPGFDSAGSIIGSVAQANYAGDSTGLAFSRTAPVSTPVNPDDAKRTRYSVTVLTAGNAALGYDPAAYARLSDDEKKMIDITLFAPENLALRQLFIDLLIPLFLSWLGGKAGDEAAGMGPREYKERIEAALFGQILSAFQSTLPSIAAKLRDPRNYPNYGVGGALSEIVRSHLIDFVDVPVPGRAAPLSVPTLSEFSISMLLLLLKYLAYERMSGASGEALLKFLDGDANDQGTNLFEWQPGKDKDGKTPKPVQFNKENLQFAGMGVATKCLALVDDGLALLSKTRLLADMASSRLLESWDVNAVKAKVELGPDPLTVDTSGTYAVTVQIVDNDNDVYGRELGSFSFDWECSALAGDLYKRGPGSETNRFTTSNANPTADYVPRGAEPAEGVLETIKVTAYFEPIGSSRPRELIGSATLPVKFRKMFNVALLPPSGQELPVDNTCGLSAALQEALPAGSTVDWQWAHAGVGSLRAGPVDANAAESSALLDTGSAEGDAVITVTARVNVPASATKPALSVLTDPVSTTLKIKRGLRTLTMTGGWTIEITVPAPGFGQATAYVVVPKISGARGYSVRLEKPTPDVPGGVPFPSTRTINPAAPQPTWEDRGGAYWSGLSGGGGADPWAYASVVPWLQSRFSSMKVTVTVTL